MPLFALPILVGITSKVVLNMLLGLSEWRDWWTVLFLVSGLLFLEVSRRIYSIYFSPLSKIPGPKLAAMTDLWLLYHLYQFQKCGTIEKCFQQYGPILRIGPNKIAFNSTNEIKTVYGIGTKFVKSKWYKTWALMGYENVFTMDDPREHAERRKITAKLMSKNNVITYLPDINQQIRAFLRLVLKAPEHVIDLMTLYQYLALDIVGTTTFGRSFDLMKTGQPHPFAKDLIACVMTIPPRGYLPKWVWWLVTKIPNKQWQFNLGAEKRIIEYADDIIHEKLAAAANNGGKMTVADSNTLIGNYVEYRDANGQPLSRGVISGEIGNMFFAGMDTTSNTLTFITWEIAQNPAIQARLFAELKERIADPTHVPNLGDVETWPYLNAVIKEGLRKYAAAPAHMERKVPLGGATLQGYYVPVGTIVGVQIYSIHRKLEIFPDPDVFVPERWLHPTEEMKRHFCPFGFGSRVCSGMHIAYLELRLTLATLVRQFELSVLPGQIPEEMDLKDFWLVFPAGKKLVLSVVPRVET